MTGAKPGDLALVPLTDCGLKNAALSAYAVKGQQKPTEHAEAPLTPSPKSVMLPVGAANMMARPGSADEQAKSKTSQQLERLPRGGQQARTYIHARRSIQTNRSVNRWSSITPQFAPSLHAGQPSKGGSCGAELPSLTLLNSNAIGFTAQQTRKRKRQPRKCHQKPSAATIDTGAVAPTSPKAVWLEDECTSAPRHCLPSVTGDAS